MKKIIYQLLPRYWGNVNGQNIKGGSLEQNGCGTFADVDDASLAYLRWLGCSYVWYTGIVKHGMDADFVKGRAGSPYAVADWYSVAPYLGTMDDFRSLVDRTHAAGLRCLIDFIPNHIAPSYSDAHGGIPTCGYCDWDWTDTVKVDYNHPDTWGRMYDIVRYWAQQGVDGFRCDMVELVPCEFFKWLIGRIKAEFPEVIFVAEVYNKDNYWKYIREVGFDLLYDKSGLYDVLHALVCRHAGEIAATFDAAAAGATDNASLAHNLTPLVSATFDAAANGSDDALLASATLDAAANDPAAAGATARAITWNWQRLGDLEGSMLNFMENHDEKRIASSSFAGSARKGLAAVAVSALFNDGAFMLYEGQEIGERGLEDAGQSGPDGRSTIYDWWSVDSLVKLHALIHTSAYESLSINEITSNTPMSVKEAELFCRYATMLRLAAGLEYGSVLYSSTDCGPVDDRSYDLCYCQGGEFDPDTMFAFLRGRLLVVCNFSSAKRTLHIQIPREASEFFAASSCNLAASDAVPTFAPFPDEVLITVPAFDFSTREL